MNKSETVKAATYAFSSIQKTFIRDVRAKFGICNLLHFPDIGQNSDKGLSNNWNFGQSFINENYHNFRSSHDIDIKLGPVTKTNNRNEATLKKLMITSCQQIVMSLSFFQIMANLQPSERRISDACSIKFSFLFSINFYLMKTEPKNL